MSDRSPASTLHEKPPPRSGTTLIGDSAPVVLASGRGKIAEQIIDHCAEQIRVPIHEDPLLASTLSKININDVIPPELYTVVAQVFAYIYRIRNHI